MALNEDIELLASVPLFGGLDRDQLRLIAFGADHVQMLRGDLLFQEGEVADCAYVVATGRLQLSRRSRGELQIDAVAEPGTMLSELALMTQVERKFNAVALDNVDVIRVARSLFHRLLQEYPEMADIVESRVRDSIGRLAQDITALQGQFE